MTNFTTHSLSNYAINYKFSSSFVTDLLSDIAIDSMSDVTNIDKKKNRQKRSTKLEWAGKIRR